VIPDLRTERGRQQAYAMGGELANTAALIEDALKHDDRERQYAAAEVLGDTSWDIMTEGREEFLDNLLDDMEGAFNERDLDFYLKSQKQVKDILATMRREQLILNDMLGLVQKLLDGHRDLTDNLAQLRAKLREKHREAEQ